MKLSVTPELSLLLKTLRAQNDLPAKEVAEHLGKSPSYLSKLENGEVKTIRRDVLQDALTIVAGKGDFFDEVLPAAVRVLQSFLEPQRLIEQMWLLQFDVVERTVAIPSAMAHDVRRHLEEAGISLSQLVQLANANQDTDLPASFPANQVVAINYEGKTRLTVRVSLDDHQVERAFSAESPLLSYLGINCLVFSMFRLMEYPQSEGKMPPDEATAVLRLTAAYMGQWGIHSLTGFSHLISSDEFIAHQEPLARANPRITERIAEALDEIAQHDALTATRQLTTFHETLQWDPAFAFKLMSIPFADLGDMGFRTKRRLLEEIEAVVARYEDLPDIEKRLEEY